MFQLAGFVIDKGFVLIVCPTNALIQNHLDEVNSLIRRANSKLEARAIGGAFDGASEKSISYLKNSPNVRWGTHFLCLLLTFAVVFVVPETCYLHRVAMLNLRATGLLRFVFIDEAHLTIDSGWYVDTVVSLTKYKFRSDFRPAFLLLQAILHQVDCPIMVKFIACVLLITIGRR